MKPNIEYVKQEMERRKWTGSQLAMKMGVSRMAVRSASEVLSRLFPMQNLKTYFFWIKWNL